MGEVVAGVTGTLSFQGALFPGGFVLIDSIRLDRVSGLWYPSLKWYMNKDLFDNHAGDVQCCDFPKVDSIPYAKDTDPVIAVANIIKNWFPDGEIVFSQVVEVTS